MRWIFDAYLKGRSSGWIAEQLTAKGIPSQSGAECWRETGVRYLLTNEKYIGDALSQKSYSCGFPFVQKRNHGERLQYYTKNSHPTIIDRDIAEAIEESHKISTLRANGLLDADICAARMNAISARLAQLRGEMVNRKVLYGYQIRNGALEIVPEEQRTVSMVFTLYNAGASYQAISDVLNRQEILYCREVPLWNKHKVKRLLENPRYTGKEGYPMLVEADIFQAAQEKTAKKNAGRQPHGEKPLIARLTPYFRCACGGKMTRLGGGWTTPSTGGWSSRTRRKR